MRRGAAMGIRLGTAGGGTLSDGLVSMVTEAVAVVAGGDVTAGIVAVAAFLGPTLLVTAPLEVATEAALLGGATGVAPLDGCTAVAPQGGGTGEAPLVGATVAAPLEGAIAAALD